MIPRGIRLNNPGNIDRGATAWQGESTMQDDPRFLRFDTPAYGLRAMMKILQNYVDRDDVDATVHGLISRWAPPGENNTDAYIAAVAEQLNVSSDTPLDLENAATLIGLAQAIAIHENGDPPDDQPDYWYGPEVYQQAAALVLS